MGILDIAQAGLVILVVAFVAVIGAIAISVVYGQGGARIFTRMQETDSIPADNDAYWKLGIFYFNPSDPSLFLLERFGVGWTINWARPAVWMIIAASVLVTAIFTWGIFSVMG